MYQTSVLVVGTTEFCSLLAAGARGETGLSVVGVTSTEAARTVLRLGTADTALAIVDAGLPDGEAFAFCGDIARAVASPPVMMVGAAESEADALRSLDAGAIDYFPRPQNQAELLARIRAHLRSLATSLDVDISIGLFTFRPGQRTLTHRKTGARTWLTAKETRLLRRLHAANGTPVSPVALLEAAWTGPGTSMHTLHTHVYRLRGKLGAGSDARPMLRTVPEGYALMH